MTPDFTITTTVEFDAGTKSDPLDGNWDIETNTDNMTVATGRIELANKYGDCFNKTDANAVTWKWIDGGSVATYDKDIDDTADDELYMTVGTTTDRGNSISRSERAFTGDFDIRVSLDATDLDTAPISPTRCRLTAYYDILNYVYMERIYDTDLANDNYIKVVCVASGVTKFSGSWVYTGTELTFKITRTGTNITVGYLSSIDDDLEGSFTTLETEANGFNDNIIVQLSLISES